MITNFEKYNLIKESPDTVLYDGEKYGMNNGFGDMPFTCTVNDDHTKVKNVEIGNQGEGHGELQFDNTRSYPGRLWLKPKILTFWVFPNVTLFKSIINNIEKQLEIDIFNNGWRMEILKVDGKLDVMKVDKSKNPRDYYYGDEDASDEYEVEAIPIDDYNGSEDVPEEIRQLHLMSWKEKQLAKSAGLLDTNFGSAKTGWDQPHNIKYRQAIYQEKKDN